MNAKAKSRLSKIEKFSAVARRLCGLGAVAVGLSLVAWLAIIGFAPASANWGLSVGSYSSIWSIGFSFNVEPGDLLYRRVSVNHIVGVKSKILLGVVALLYHVWVLKFWYHSFRLFGNYARGDIFAKDNSRQIRLLGINTLLGSIAQFLPALFAYLLRQAGDQPWLPPVDVNVGSLGSFWPLLAGPLIVFVSWVMDVGREIGDENRELEAERALVI